MDVNHANAGKDPVCVPLGHTDPFHGAQYLHGIGHPRQNEPTPGEAQPNAEGRLVGAVSADIADERPHEAVVGLHDIEEVASQQRALPPRPVARDDPDAIAGDQRPRQQTSFQTGVLGCQEAGVAQLRRGGCRRLALHRVTDRPSEQVPVDLALDQIVLRATGDRGDRCGLVGHAGQHQDGGFGNGMQHQIDGVQAEAVWQVEIEQHAVDLFGQLIGGFGKGTAPHHRDVQPGVGEQLLHQKRVGFVVFDEHHPQRYSRPFHSPSDAFRWSNPFAGPTIRIWLRMLKIL
jgi:hypothetical protein